MSLLAGIGSSKKSSAEGAIEEALGQAIPSLRENRPSCILLFASPTTYDQAKLLSSLQSRYPDTPVIGCSTSGEISSRGVFDGSLTLMVIYSDLIKFIPSIGTRVREDPRAAGKEFAQSVITRSGTQKPTTAIILPDGLAGNGADVVRGVLDVFGEDFQFAGGSAADDFQFQQTFQYFGGQVFTNNVVGFGLTGVFTFGIGVKHGWIPIGTSRKVTKSRSNVLYELDGKPAIQIYQDQFGDDVTVITPNEPFARLAITYPLGILLPSQNEYLIRDPLSVNEEGAITCAAEVPEGSEVFIMIGGKEEAINAAETAAQDAIAQLNGKKPALAILFNCIARKKLLMSKKNEEILKIRSIIGEEVPLIGFYTYGEQAPLGKTILTCSFHNETDVVFLLAE